ncbi:MAG: hypothetical protein QOE82_2875 [Thermoanaerobaculia bacterium]|nr:hypothetical protein [Thermoanaerobaculia bacterium]
MLYLATEEAEPLASAPELSVNELDPANADVIRSYFSLPHVRHIGAHTGCSCGFPSVESEELIDYFDGMFDDSEDRTADLESVRALLALIRRHAANGHRVELFPVWFMEEGSASKGTLDVSASSLEAETFFFNRQYLYRIHA